MNILIAKLLLSCLFYSFAKLYFYQHMGDSCRLISAALHLPCCSASCQLYLSINISSRENSSGKFGTLDDLLFPQKIKSENKERRLILWGLFYIYLQ